MLQRAVRNAGIQVGYEGRGVTAAGSKTGSAFLEGYWSTSIKMFQAHPAFLSQESLSTYKSGYR